jgi:tRNA threonylcarbamoyladenosine biosynthesis protein TsaB
MIVLAFDTSSAATPCALVRFEGERAETLAQALHLPPAKAGDLLPDALAALCGEAGRALSQIDALAVGLGPGSFTGLRVGLAAAKGLAYALRKPLAGASSLEALALPALQEGRTVVPALEARKGELFVAAFAASGACVRPAAVVPAAAAASWLAGLASPLLVGPGARSNRAQLEAGGLPASAFEREPCWPSAAAVARLCAPALSKAAFDAASLFALAPDYLAPSEPEKALAEGRVGKLPGKA